jgi:Domain of unknown function (DUF4382)
MRKTAALFFTGAMLASLVGCGRTPGNDISNGLGSGSSEVSLSITDEPPSGVTVLFFQIGITSAYLTPASGSATISLLNNNMPIEVDVTQLQAISAFLSAANVPAGTYNSLSIEFANPQLVIFNASDSSIASTCAVGSICQLTPTINNSATVTFASTPFPVTIGQNSQLGFLLDFYLNNVIQSDLSVNLGASNGVTVSELPSFHPQFGFLVGTVANVSTSGNNFSLITPDGRTFTVDVNSSTTFDDFPSSNCATGSIACLVSGQVVQIQVASIEPKRVLLASSVTFLQAAGQQMVEGNIIGLSTSGGTTTMTLILHRTPFNSGNLPLGGEAQVDISSSATFSADLNGFTLPAGLAFTGTSDLVVGQEVTVQVTAGSLTTSSGSGGFGMWGPPPSVSFTTDSVVLEPSQITGNITTVDSSTSSFTLSIQPSMFFGHSSSGTSTSSTINVDATSQTNYFNLNPDSFSGLAPNSMVSVQGWLFPPASGASSPTMAAENVVGRPFGFF